jgi:hypothetical protein
MEYVSSHIICYQNVSIAFVIIIIIIIRVSSQEYSVHNKLPNCVSGATQLYDRCLGLYIWSQNVS